jgi:hypothetical protein
MIKAQGPLRRALSVLPAQAKYIAQLEIQPEISAGR